MNILLINPSSMPSGEQEAFLDRSSILRVPSFSMPIGLIDMASYARSRLDDISISVLDMGKDLFKVYLDYKNTNPTNLKSFIGSELDAIGFKPDIVGISILFSSANNSSLLIAEEVKARWKDAIVVCGGNHATNYYSNLLKNPNIDYVIRGEGELSFVQLVTMLQNGARDFDVQGVIDRNKLHSVNVDTLSPLQDDLDKMPLPAFDLLDIEFYKKTIGGSIMFSRGCPFECSFCASHTVHGRRVRFKSRERIMNEFRLIIDEYGFDKIVIEDDLFAARKDVFLDVSERLSIKYPAIKISLPQGLSVSVLNTDIIDAMIRMGIFEAAVAIESGSSHVQKAIIKKDVSLPKARHVLEYLRKKGFFVYANFIFGFPGESKEMMQESVNFINTLDVDWVYIFHALPLPGSEMYKYLVSKGIIDPDTFDWDGVRLGRRVFDTPEISASDLCKLVYDTNIECNFFNNSNIRHLRYDRAIDLFNRYIIEPYPFHVVGRYCRGIAYLRMDKHEEAETDFRECIKWIGVNDESRRLFLQYGGKMQYLKEFMDK